ncbi:MAG TPA: hypothetical protein VLY04_25720 [Bryobacteraceae bacterium]|nr:hypothetical protein [Bryobacteraceae bacterium]
MKKSASVTVSIVAAVGIAAGADQRLDPCSSTTFDEAACRAAIQNNGYCWNGRWVRLKYHYPFPYYYDTYWEFVTAGGVANPAVVGTCGPPRGGIWGAHGALARAGFGSTGACHSAHS